jgi:hypothetical protein
MRCIRERSRRANPYPQAIQVTIWLPAANAARGKIRLSRVAVAEQGVSQWKS